MKAKRDELANDFNKRKALFKRLFSIQMELENYHPVLECSLEIREVVRSIDQLMEALLCMEENDQV